MKKIAIAALFVAASAPVFADTGFYAGGSLGSASKAVPGTTESSASFGVFGGYSVTQNFGFEVGYTDLGSVSAGTIKFTSVNMSAIGTYPLNRDTSLYGKLGMANTNEKSAGVSASRSAVTYGVGAQFNIDKNIGIRLGYDRASFGDGALYTQGNSNNFSLGALYKF